MSNDSIERLRHALGQRRQQIDAEAHIAGLDDHRALGRFRDLGFVARRDRPVVPMMCTLPALAASAAKATVAAGMVKSMMPSACGEQRRDVAAET